MLYGATCSAPFQTTLIQKVVTRNEQEGLHNEEVQALLFLQCR